MEKSCINDTSSSKSTAAEHLNSQPAQQQPCVLLVQLRKLIGLPADLLSEALLGLASDFQSFLLSYEALVRQTTILTEEEFKLAVLLNLTLSEFGNDNRLIANFHELISEYEGPLIRSASLAEFVFDAVLGLCLGRMRLGFQGIVANASTGMPKEQHDKLLSLPNEDIQSSNIIRTIVLSKLYSKLCEISSLDLLYRLLLLTSVIARVDILSDDIIESLLDRVVDILENMERRLSDQEMGVLLKIMTKNRWKDEWTLEDSEIKGKPICIQFRLQKIVNVVAKKLIREKELRNRNDILKVVLRYFNSTVLLSNQKLLETFIMGLRREADPAIEDTLQKMVNEAVKGEPTLKIVKSIIKNMKISTAQKNSSEVEKIFKNFELLETVRRWNRQSHQVLELFGKCSAVYFESIGVKVPYTIMMEVKLKAKLHEPGYLVTLNSKRTSISILIRKKLQKKDYCQLKIVDNNDSKNLSDIYDVEAPCEKVYLSMAMSDQHEGLLVTVNNFCFLVQAQLSEIRSILIGNNIVAGKLTHKCAIQELSLFLILNEFLETSQLFCRFRMKEITTAQFKQSTQDLKVLVNLNSNADWESKSTSGVFGRFFHAAEEVASQIECYKTHKFSLLKVLQNTGNLDVFLLLIEYYSFKAKESEFLVLTDCILGFLQLLISEDDEKKEMRGWLHKSLNKFGLAIWIISYTAREKNDLISKIMGIIGCADGFRMPTGEVFNHDCLKALLLNFQIWRNFSFEEQLVAFSIVEKYLKNQQLGCAQFCLQHNQLRRVLIAIVTYYKMDITPEAGIKRRLSKQALLRLQMRCRELFVNCLTSTFKSVVESRNKQRLSTWMKSAISALEIAIVVSEAVVSSDNNPYYSKQSLLEILRVVRRLVDVLSSKESCRQFQELLNKEEPLKSIDSLLLIMLEQQMASGGARFKRTTLYSLQVTGSQDRVVELEESAILDLLEDVLLDVLLIKQYSVEAITEMFERLRRRQRDPVEVSFIFRLILKLQAAGLPGCDLLYSILSTKTRDNLSSQSYYLYFRDSLEKFICSVDHKYFVDALNSLADLLGDVMRQDCENRQLAKLILQRYLECERMEPISPAYFVHINRIKQFPEVSRKTPAVNIYRLGSAMEYSEFISFLEQNQATIQTIDNDVVGGGIVAFMLVRMPMLPTNQIVRLIGVHQSMVRPEKSNKVDMVADLALFRLFRRVTQLLEDQNSKELIRDQYNTIMVACHALFSETVLNRLFKHIVFEDYLPSSVPRGGLSLELEGFFKLFSGEQPVGIDELNEHRDILEKVCTTIQKYAQKPIQTIISQVQQKLTLGKYQAKALQKGTGQATSNSKTINVDRARDAYEDMKMSSFDMISDYFEDYESKCMDTEQSWKRDKQLNYYWQYFTFSKESNFYSVDNSINSLFSRINIKVSSTDSSQQFPRRKAGSARYRLSSQNNSSISKSESENDMMMKSMVFDNSNGKKKANNRKQSEDVIVEKEGPGMGVYYCEYVKPEGVLFGKCEVKDNIMTFHSNPNEEAHVKKDIYMELSTSDHLKLKKQKKKTFELPVCSIFTRRYVLRHTAIEIFYKGKAYFFNFFLKTTRDTLLKLLKKKVQACIVNRKLDFQKELLTERWKTGRISNFEYLMKLNIYSGRTYNDLGQYPVFPWVLKNFKAERMTKEILQNPSSYRDLTLPMGKQNPQRFEQFVKRMNEGEEGLDNSKFLYGSFYSNPTIIAHYLIRLEPFSTIHWKHQSKRFDHADRLFSSIEDQYTSSTKNTSDLKQLIPEFYSWPEFLRNRNQLEFGRKQNKAQVNHVECPKWASCSQQVIFRFREALESDHASKHLHRWIDLIFGYKSKQKDALSHHNLFHNKTYEHDIFENHDQDDIRLAQTYVSEFGQVPEALFDKQHVAKQSVEVSTLDTMYVIEECPDCSRLVLSEDDWIMVSNNKIMHLLQVNILQMDSRLSKKHTFNLKPGHKKAQFLNSPGGTRWTEFTKTQLHIGTTAGMKGRETLCQGRNMTESALIDQHSLVTAEESRLVFRTIKDSKAKIDQVSHCHQDHIYIVEYCRISDLVVSVDRDNVVGLHYGKQQLKIRVFTIQLKERELVKRIRIHPLGMILLWTNQQRLKAYSFVGDRFFGVQFKLPMLEQEITQIRLFSIDKSNFLVSTNKGFIYSLDFFDVYRFSRDNPRIPYEIEGLGVLASMMNLPPEAKKMQRRGSSYVINESILDFEVDWTHKPFWKLVVLYERGKVCYYMNHKEKEERIHEQIREISFS